VAKMDLGPSTQPAPNLIGKAGALSTYPQQSTDVRLRGVTRFRGYGCPEATVCPSSAGTGAPIPSFEQGAAAARRATTNFDTGNAELDMADRPVILSTETATGSDF